MGSFFFFLCVKKESSDLTATLQNKMVQINADVHVKESYLFIYGMQRRLLP